MRCWAATIRKSGFMDVVVRDRVSTSQRYLPNSAILETLIEDKHGGVLRLLDFAPRFRRFGRMFRPPQLVRRIEPVSGRPRMGIRLRPNFDYGARQPQLTSGSNHVRYVGSDTVLRLTTDAPISYVLHETEFVLDRPLTLIIGADETVTEAPDAIGRTFLQETELYWQEWVRDLHVPFDWQEAVIRAAITLKLCSYEDTGAVLAALTTSVPEHDGSGRNWDYRYCWLRDAFFTVTALNRLSRDAHHGRLRPLHRRCRRAQCRRRHPAAVRHGARHIATTSAILQSLPGYRGEGPVRVGNAAVSQRQNDAYGSIVMTAAQMFWDERLPRRGDTDLYRQLCLVGDEAERVALDARCRPLGVPRARAGPHVLGRHVLGGPASPRHDRRAASASSRIGRLVRRRQGPAPGRSSKRATDRRTAAAASGVLDGEVVDASSLRAAGDRPAVVATDPRFIATVDIVTERLLRNGFVMRYAEADDFGEPRNAFLLCTFWYIDALAAVGRRDEARDMFNNVLSRRNHFGLLVRGRRSDDRRAVGQFPADLFARSA